MNKVPSGLALIWLLASSCVPLPMQPGDDAEVPDITVDGILSDGEWDQATVFHFDANLPGGRTAPASVYLTSDAVDLYVAVRFRRSIVDAGNGVGFEFDTDRDNTVSAGDDGFVVNPGAGILSDIVRVTSEQYPPCPAAALCGPRDEELGGTNDGAWGFGHDGS
jgi:hypothetical protein